MGDAFQPAEPVDHQEGAPPLIVGEIKTSPELAKFAEALSLAQEDVNDPVKNRNNPYFKSDYADLQQVLSVVRPAFSAHGLSLIQLPHSVTIVFDGKHTIRPAVTTRVLHSSGQWMECTLVAPPEPPPSDPDKKVANPTQKMGLAITYMRRFAAAGVSAVAQKDVDGNTGAQEPRQRRRGVEPRATPPPLDPVIQKRKDELGSRITKLVEGGADAETLRAAIRKMRLDDAEQYVGKLEAGETPEPPAEPAPAPAADTHDAKGRPYGRAMRRDDGTYGAVMEVQEIEVGTEIMLRTRAGRKWPEVVSEVTGMNNKGFPIVSTVNRDAWRKEHEAEADAAEPATEPATEPADAGQEE